MVAYLQPRGHRDPALHSALSTGSEAVRTQHCWLLSDSQQCRCLLGCLVSRAKVVAKSLWLAPARLDISLFARSYNPNLAEVKVASKHDDKHAVRLKRSFKMALRSRAGPRALGAEGPSGTGLYKGWDSFCPCTLLPRARTCWKRASLVVNKATLSHPLSARLSFLWPKCRRQDNWHNEGTKVGALCMLSSSQIVRAVCRTL